MVKIFSFLSVSREPREIIPKSTLIHFNDLEEWLLSQKQDLISTPELGEETINYAAALTEKKLALEYALNQWQEKLPYLKDPLKIREISLLFNDIRKALESVNFPQPTTLELVMKLNHTLEGSISLVSKRVGGSTSIDFFFAKLGHISSAEIERSNLANPLLQKLIEFKEIQNQFKEKIVKSGFLNLEVLKDKVSFIEEEIETIKRLNQRLRVKKVRLQGAEDRLKQKEKELSLLKNAPQYSSWEQAEHRRTQLLGQLEVAGQEITSFFSLIAPLLREYINRGGNRIILRYISNPIEALYQDENLNVVSVLDELKKGLVSGTFQYDVDKRTEVLNHFDKVIMLPYLQQLQGRISTLRLELQQVSKPKDSQRFLSKMDEIQYRLNHFHQQVQKLREEVSNAEQKCLDKEAHRDHELDLFKQEVEEALGIDLEIQF